MIDCITAHGAVTKSKQWQLVHCITAHVRTRCSVLLLLCFETHHAPDCLTQEVEHMLPQSRLSSSADTAPETPTKITITMTPAQHWYASLDLRLTSRCLGLVSCMKCGMHHLCQQVFQTDAADAHSQLAQKRATHDKIHSHLHDAPPGLPED